MISSLAGRIGSVRRLAAHFDVPIPYSPGELRHTLEVGGGALMDLGCYPLHWVRTVMRSEPSIVAATAIQERPGIDASMQATLSFGDVPAEIRCSMAADVTFGAALVIDGDHGSIAVTNPLAPHNGHELTLTVDGQATSESVDGQSTYWHQLTYTLDQLAGQRPLLTGGDDAVANMRAIDAIYRAAGMQPRGII